MNGDGERDIEATARYEGDAIDLEPDGVIDGWDLDDDDSIDIADGNFLGWDYPESTGVHDRAIDYNGNILIVKLDANGEIVWEKDFGTDKTDTPLGIFLDPSGRLVVPASTAGFFMGASRAGQVDPMVLTLDPATGDLLNAKVHNINGSEICAPPP